MDCRAFRDLFSDYVDDALATADALRCRDHVLGCAPCRRLEAAYRTGVATLRHLDPPTPARDLSVRILHRARREPRLAVLAGGYGLAAALLVITLVGVVAVDMQERRADRDPASVRIVGAAPVADARMPGGLDVITVRMRDASIYGPPVTPYVIAPAADPDQPYNLRLEIPAVWSGR